MAGPNTRTWRHLLGRGQAVWPDAGAGLLLLLLCLLFFWRILTPDPLNRAWFAPGDFTDQFWATRIYLAHELAQGRLPLWNPYNFAGGPFLADSQTAVLYPPVLLTALFFGRGGFSLELLEYEAVFHYLLTSVFTYLLIRRLTSRRLPALVSAIAYTYGSYLTSYPKLQLAILEAQTWLPLTLFFVDLAAQRFSLLEKKGGLAALALASLGLGSAALAGHPQTFSYVFYLSLAFLIFRLFFSGDRDLRLRDLRSWAIPLAFVVLGLGVAAVQLLPGWEFARLSTRARLSFASAAGGFLYSELVSLIQPGLRLLYLGALPTLLLALGLLFRWKREVIFWGGVALVSLLLSLGGQSFTYVAAYLVAPGFSLFRDQERAALIFAFASSVLAGYGARALLGPMGRPQRRLLRRFVGVVARVWLAALALALAAYLVAEYGNRSGQSGIYGPLERSIFLALFLGLGGLIVAARSRGRRSLVLGTYALIVTALELFSLNWRNDLAGPESPRRFQAGPAVERMQGDPGLFRIQDDYRIPGNFGCVLGLQDIGGISPLKVQRYETLAAALPEGIKWQLLNVKYLHTDRTSVPGATLLSSYGSGQLLYQVNDPGARASVVFQAQVEPDERRALALVAGPGFNPRQKVVLSQSPGIPIGSGGRGQARVTAYNPERIEVTATLEGNGVLVLSEVYYPGWRVLVDGREDRLLRADFALRAVALPAGEHRVVLVYDPWTFKAGALLSLASLAACIALLALGSRALVHRPGT